MSIVYPLLNKRDIIDQREIEGIIDVQYLKEVLCKKNKIFCFGAGKIGKEFCKEFTKEKNVSYDELYFVDSDTTKQGITIHITDYAMKIIDRKDMVDLINTDDIIVMTMGFKDGWKVAEELRVIGVKNQIYQFIYSCGEEDYKANQIDCVVNNYTVEELKCQNQNRHIGTVDIVICVHNALEDFKKCFTSLVIQNTYGYQCIIVDDGSNDDTKEYLQELSNQMNVKLLRNDTSKGYTKSANMGLYASKADYVVLLNSDTIVTRNWIEKMVKVYECDNTVGIVGTLSNAAYFQSVPYWKESVLNEESVFPSGFTIEDMNELIESVS